MMDDRSYSAAPARFDVLDLARGLAILGMLGSHLVGTDGGATAFERGITGFLATIEPTVGAAFCVLAGISWRIQAERVGATAPFRRYLAGRALALGAFGVVFHLLFWKTEILVPFALMMALSLLVLDATPRLMTMVLVAFVAVTPLVGRVIEPYAATDWLDNGLHAADQGVGWATLRYLAVDGNYPLISWMAFPLMGMLFWQTSRNQPRILAWAAGSCVVAVVAYAAAAATAPEGTEHLRDWIAHGWTPTSAIFVLTAGGGALAVIAALLWQFGTAPLPRFVQPLVLFGRASLSHYVLHIAIAYSLLRLLYPQEDWSRATGLRALVAYLAIGIPLTVIWFRRHTHGPLETWLARSSKRPGPPSGGGDRLPVEVVRGANSTSLHARHSFERGEVVFPLEGRLVAQPTRFTIQVAPSGHLEPLSDHESPWKYLNHGCHPNVEIQVHRRAVVAGHAIAPGDELRFDYNTTEWELAEPFVCNCGAPDCVGMTMGFVHLSPARQRALIPDAALHVRALHALARQTARPRPYPMPAFGARGQVTAGTATDAGAIRA